MQRPAQVAVAPHHMAACLRLAELPEWDRHADRHLRSVRTKQAVNLLSIKHLCAGYGERRVVDGDVKQTMLPTHLDAMAGQHHGRIYAVRNVYVRQGERTFVVALAAAPKAGAG